ncbi:hypothetical protein HUA74_34910 [Myxococcus sp. CA051A]|uniref:hypothetical protein n=1 Tax=unclassified Myxococcus TaxID=2648731 RepID=UPI00157B60A0|nr:MULTISPECIES: hypothetical protein [unclassified Myxococcus]NTX52229.1 hypothetical protein [Myxococcus sp. CA039A]NTX65863.1 hypothetical protein [Myxococcus sp. CA051A]
MTDHLRPEPGSFSQISSSSYESELARLLIPNTSWTLLLVRMPSFTPEEAVYIHEKWPGPRVIATRMESMLWPIVRDASRDTGGTRALPSVEVVSAPIEPPLLEALKRLWNAALLRTRFPPKAHVYLDGTSYHLGAFCRGVGSLTGRTWSPPPASRMAGLVDIGEKLTRYARGPEEQRASIADALIEESADLLQRFESEDAFGGPARG